MKQTTLRNDRFRIALDYLYENGYVVDQRELSAKTGINEASTSSNRAVYLDRVVTRLRMLVNDEVPATISKVHLTISKWFFGLNYMTGAAAAQNVRDVEIAVPASLQGTTGELIVSAYGFSDEEVWNADITLTAISADNSVLGTVTIPDAPFKRNRITQYGGNLFASAGEMGIGLNTEWATNYEATW